MLLTYLLLGQVAAQSVVDTGPQAPPQEGSPTVTKPIASTPISPSPVQSPAESPAGSPAGSPAAESPPAESPAAGGPSGNPAAGGGASPAPSPSSAVSAAGSSPAGSPTAGGPSGVPAAGGGAGSTAASGGSETSVSTAVPSVSGSPDTPVPGQDTVPPQQWWCADNATYCPGRLLQDVQLSGVFPDSKTFVDKPTNGTLNDTLNAFNALGTNVTVGGIATFASDWFKGEGLELQPVEIEGFNPNPAILENVTDPLYKAWVSTVHGYWTLLIRETNESALCQPGPEGCSSSLIPLNQTIVVPGGRYREVYYWDSYWILQGLLASELDNYAWNLLQNFMDLVEAYGFIPNGGRKYYLNRSQPPVFTHMVHAYVMQTGNTTILDRALPLLDAELAWWETNRTTNVTSPFTNKTHTVAHFAVNNSAPRPEGFVEDHDAAFGTAENPQNFTEQERSDLYAELASGAESGWDYTARWCREPLLNETDNNVVLRTLNVRGIIPVDLTALLASSHYLVAELYEMHAGGGGGGGAGGGNGTGHGGGHKGPTQNDTTGGTQPPSPTGPITSAVGGAGEPSPAAGSPSPASPPAESPPAESPPAESPPAESPPAESPPAESPPAESPPAESPPAESPAAQSPAKRQGADPALSLPGGPTGPEPSLPPQPTPTPQGPDPALNPGDQGGDSSPADPAAAPTDASPEGGASPTPDAGSPAGSPSPTPDAGSPAGSPSPTPDAGSPAGSPSPTPDAGSPAGSPSPSPAASPPVSPAGGAESPQPSAGAPGPSQTPEASPQPSDGGVAGGTPGGGHNATTGGAGTGGNQTGGAGSTGGGSSDKAAAHRAKGDAYKAAVLDLHWDAERAYFYDYNISANAHSPVYSPAGLWPLWLNITPDGLEGNEEMALKIASGQRYILGKYAGVPSVATLLKTGLNWDFPNVWPPHVYTTLKAFETLHRLVPNASTVDAIGIPFDQVAPNQFNLDEASLPEQPQSTIGNTSLFTDASEPWPKQMAIEIANRYMTDAFCSWYSTGGSIPGVLQQLPLSDLNATGTWTPDQAGHMFEKFNVTDPDAAGGGGEYTVQIGFGWTNGVVLWAAGRYGQYLPPPTCPLIPIEIGEGGGGAAGNGTTDGGGAAGNGTMGNGTDSGGGNATAPAPGDAGTNATDPAGAAGMNGTKALFVGHRIPRK